MARPLCKTLPKPCITFAIHLPSFTRIAVIICTGCHMMSWHSMCSIMNNLNNMPKSRMFSDRFTLQGVHSKSSPLSFCCRTPQLLRSARIRCDFEVAIAVMCYALALHTKVMGRSRKLQRKNFKGKKSLFVPKMMKWV